MIYLNGRKVTSTTAIDGTTQLDEVPMEWVGDINHIDWIWEREEKEFFVLAQLKTLLNSFHVTARLNIPTLPYSMAESPISYKGNWALHPFAELINRLEFESVHTFDVYSMTAQRLINRLENESPGGKIQDIVDELTITFEDSRGKMLVPPTAAYLNGFLANKYGTIPNLTNLTLVIDKHMTFDPYAISGRNVLIIVNTLRSPEVLADMIKRLKLVNPKSINLYVSHAMFIDTAVADLQAMGVSRIWTKEGEVETEYTRSLDGDLETDEIPAGRSSPEDGEEVQPLQ